MLDAAADSYNGEPLLAVTDRFSRRALFRPMTFRKDFVHNRDAGGVLIVVLGKIAALLERDLHRGKIGGADRPHLCRQFHAWRRGLAFDFVAIAPGAVAERQMSDDPDRDDAGQGPRAGERIAGKTGDAVGVRISFPPKAWGECD